MQVKCPACKTVYEVEDSYYGENAECEVCGRKFIVGSTTNLDGIRLQRRKMSVADTYDGQSMSFMEEVNKQKIHKRPQAHYVVRINYTSNQIYFSQQNTASALFNYVIGICASVLIGLIVVGVVAIAASKILGVLLFIALIVGVYFVVKSRPRILTDKEIDFQASALGSGIDNMAFDKLGIDPEEVSLAEPLRFWGYNFVFERVLPDDANIAAWWIQGKDGKWRSSEVTHTVFYFGEHSIYCYKRTLSLVSSASKHETEEYFYRDIVSVKTETTRIPNADRFINVNMFVLTNSGGEKLACVTDKPQEAEVAVKAVRTLLKQKKF